MARLNATALEARNASIRIIDFSPIADYVQRPSGRWQDADPRPTSPEGFALNKQQIYRRMKRARDAYLRKTKLSEAEVAVRYKKPLAEWDSEELARGRPRDAQGGFKGPKPHYVSAEIHEEAMDRFKQIIKTDMRVATVDAVKLLRDVINNEELDNRGKALVPASTKVQAAQFLIEHVVGKPTQRIEGDVSVKLQALLGAVMVNPEELASGGNFVPGHMPGYTMELTQFQGEDDDDPIDDGDGE